MFPWTDSDTPLRFDAFMAAALLDPHRGYYASRIRQVGHGGDFTTTAAIAPAFGKAVAAWAADALRETGVRDLIELGPGDGRLAEAVLKHLPWALRFRLRFHLVERSTSLRELQRSRLGKRVRWHDDIDQALEAAGGEACLYSNEFVDAFPVRRFRHRRGAWEELHLLPGRELWLPAGPLPASTIFDHRWPEDQIVEVHESYRDWQSAMLERWHRGRMLTIDYGAQIDDLYRRRPSGTLRGYLHQQRLTGAAVYDNPGRQDLTADVNFSDLINWPGDRLATVRLIDQARFLRSAINPRSPADIYAADPDGPGSAFLCLDQRRQR